MLSVDLSVMATQAQSAHLSLPVFTCNDQIIELVMNKNFQEEWQCFLDSQAFYLVLDGSLTFYAGAQKSFQVNAGEYVLVEAGSPFMLKDISGCNYLSVHKRSYNRVSHPPLATETVEKHGNFKKDLAKGTLEFNQHCLKLLTNENITCEEVMMDSDRAIFAMEGEIAVGAPYGEDVLESNEIVNVPAHTFHRLYAERNTVGFTLYKKSAKIALFEASN